MNEAYLERLEERATAGTVREASLLDIPALVGLLAADIAEEWHATPLASVLVDTLRGLLENPASVVLVAGSYEGLLICHTSEQYPGGPLCANVCTLYVVPERRTSRLALQLVNHGIGWARERGAKHAQLWQRGKLPSVYNGLGFEAVETAYEVTL